MQDHPIYQIFRATFNPDFNVRAQAELELRKLDGAVEGGFLSLVLQIIMSHESELPVRQAAAIYFKNSVSKKWSPYDATITGSINDADRALIKAQLLPAIVHVPHSIRVQLTSVLGTILDSDFPDKWPEFMGQLEHLLTNGEAVVMMAGLLALQELVKCYQWKHGAKREPLNNIIAAVFPHVCSIAENLINAPADNAEAGMMLKTILKTYFTSIQYELSKNQQQQDVMVRWGTIFLKTVQKDIPETLLSDDVDDKPRHPWWKAKKWACHSLNRLFSRYGNPATTTSEKEYGAFAATFVTHFAPEILKCYLSLIENQVNGRYISPRVQYLVASFLSDSVKHKTTWNILKPNFEKLLSGFIFPLLCFTEEENEQFEDDPVEFVQKQADPMEDFKSPVSASVELLITLIKDRKKFTFMPTLQFIQSVLQHHANDPYKKDGALHMIASIAPATISKKSPVKANMEQFLVTHVFPEFQSTHAFLRMRACDVLNKFDELEWSSRENLHMAFTSILKCLMDDALPVKIQGALALEQFVKHDDVREIMKTHVPQIMQELLKMTNQIDMDTLTTVMELFVDVFGDEVKPFAVELAVQLRDTFIRIVNDTLNLDEENMNDDEMQEASDKTFAAMGVLKTISTLCISVETSRDILLKLEEVIVPILAFVFEKNAIDLYDETFDIVDTITYCSKQISEPMWRVFALIYKVFKTDAIDYIEEMLPALDNYIRFGRDVFMVNDELKSMMVDVAATILNKPDSGASEKVHACILIESMLLNLKGGLDNFVPTFLEWAINAIKAEPKTKSLLIYMLEIIINCIYYNAPLTLSLLETANFTTSFFQKWFSEADHFARVHDKRLSILAVCNIISMPAAQLPASIRQAWGEIMKGLLAMFEEYPEALEERKRLKEMYEGVGDDDGFDDDEEDEFDGLDDDDEDGHPGRKAQFATADEEDGNVIDMEGEAYLEYLAKKEEESGSESDWDEEELQEDVYFETVLDTIDPYIVFHNTMGQLHATQPDSYAALISGLNPKQQTLLTAVAKIAEENKNKPAEPEKKN